MERASLRVINRLVIGNERVLTMPIEGFAKATRYLHVRRKVGLTVLHGELSLKVFSSSPNHLTISCRHHTMTSLVQLGLKTLVSAGQGRFNNVARSRRLHICRAWGADMLKPRMWKLFLPPQAVWFRSTECEHSSRSQGITCHMGDRSPSCVSGSVLP